MGLEILALGLLGGLAGGLGGAGAVAPAVGSVLAPAGLSASQAANPVIGEVTKSLREKQLAAQSEEEARQVQIREAAAQREAETTARQEAVTAQSQASLGSSRGLSRANFSGGRAGTILTGNDLGGFGSGATTLLGV